MKTLQELRAEKAELMAQIDGATAEQFAELRTKIEKVNLQIKEAETAENERNKEKADAEMRAAREPSANVNIVDLFDQKIASERAAKKAEMEKRGKSLRNGEKITLVEKRQVTSKQTAMSTVASDTINPAFEQVGTIDTLVNVTDLDGGEAYKKPFVKSYGEGGITAEGTAATDTDPAFGYATINKIKITAYAEVTEEVEKLPDAEYSAEVEKAVLGAYRKKLQSQIINGTGSNELVGIVNAPETIIEKSQRKTIATIDENTLDNIIFEYGGDENVEGDAALVLHKLTLKEFAKVKGSDKKRAYDIVVRGNSGTINGIPFVCTSKLAPFATVEQGKPYMLYGNLKGYELTNFSNIEIQKSKDYKFKEGVTAYKVSRLVGGSPAAWNGFMSIEKQASEAV